MLSGSVWKQLSSQQNLNEIRTKESQQYIPCRCTGTLLSRYEEDIIHGICHISQSTKLRDPKLHSVDTSRLLTFNCNVVIILMLWYSIIQIQRGYCHRNSPNKMPIGNVWIWLSSQSIFMAFGFQLRAVTKLIGTQTVFTFVSSSCVGIGSTTDSFKSRHQRSISTDDFPSCTGSLTASLLAEI